MVLSCFVLNPHRRSPYPKSHLELRDKLRVGSPVHARGTAESCYFPPFSFVFGELLGAYRGTLVERLCGLGFQEGKPRSQALDAF